MQADGEDLIGTKRSVLPSSVNQVVEAARLPVPEARVETLTCARGHPGVLALVRYEAEPAGELFHRAQGVVPERLNLDGLAAPRRDDVVADLRVHPRQLHALRA